MSFLIKKKRSSTTDSTKTSRMAKAAILHGRSPSKQGQWLVPSPLPLGSGTRRGESRSKDRRISWESRLSGHWAAPVLLVDQRQKVCSAPWDGLFFLASAGMWAPVGSTHSNSGGWGLEQCGRTNPKRGTLKPKTPQVSFVKAKLGFPPRRFF